MKKFTILFICFIFSFVLIAQEGPSKIPATNKVLKRAQVGLDLLQKTSVRGQNIENIMGKNYKVVKTITQGERTTLRMQYFHKDIPVLGSEICVNLRGKKVIAVDGYEFKINTALNTTPSFSKEDAISLAQAYFQANRSLKVEDNKLAIFCTNSACYLVWNFILTNNNNIRWRFIIDAHKGNIVASYNLIQVFTLEGSTQILSDGEFHGPEVNFTCESDGDVYRLASVIEGTKVLTYDMENQTDSWWNPWNPVAGEEAPSKVANPWEDKVAATAHFYTEQVAKFYKEVFHRSSIDDKNFSLKTRVHCGKNYENAYWNGSMMTYGDGAWDPATQKGRFSALCVADVICHELTHGYTSKSSQLVYRNESGAMNEAMSDILGTAFEYWMKTKNEFAHFKCDWKEVGEECVPQGSELGRNALRFMDDPTKAKQPKFYKGEFWYSGSGDNGGVHTNCAVGNHAFFLMAEEGGVLLAAKIFFYTNLKYLTSNATYSVWPKACNDALENDITEKDLQLYGTPGITKAKMKAIMENAWKVVGVMNRSSARSTLNATTGSGYIKENEILNHGVTLKAKKQYTFTLHFKGKDADLYLYNQSGLKVASSKKSGNKEVIVITPSQTGLYTISAHAFSGNGTATITITK